MDIDVHSERSVRSSGKERQEKVIEDLRYFSRGVHFLRANEHPETLKPQERRETAGNNMASPEITGTRRQSWQLRQAPIFLGKSRVLMSGDSGRDLRHEVRLESLSPERRRFRSAGGAVTWAHRGTDAGESPGGHPGGGQIWGTEDGSEIWSGGAQPQGQPDCFLVV